MADICAAGAAVDDWLTAAIPITERIAADIAVAVANFIAAVARTGGIDDFTHSLCQRIAGPQVVVACTIALTSHYSSLLMSWAENGL